MAEDQNTSEDELFDTSEDEGGSPNVSTTFDDSEDTTEDGSDESDETEENKDTLDLEDQEDKSSAKEKREQQVTAWYAKILANKAKIEDIPKAQKWLIKPLMERLEADKKEAKIAEDYDIDAIVSRKLSEERDRQHFRELHEALSDQSLTREQRITLNTEFKDLRKEGLSKVKALQAAMKIAGVELEDDNRRKYMAPLRAGSKDKESTDSDDPRKKYPKGDPRRAKALSDLANQFQ